MRHVLRSLLFGTLLLSALGFVSSGSPQALAASIDPQTNGSNAHLQPQPYNSGRAYQDGYQACQQEHSHFHPVGIPPQGQYHSVRYEQAFKQGYDACEAQYSHNNYHNPPNGHPSGGNPPHGNPPNGNPPHGNPPPNGHPSGGNPPHGNTPPNGHPSGGNPPNGNNPPNGHPSGGNPPHGNNPPNVYPPINTYH